MLRAVKDLYATELGIYCGMARLKKDFLKRSKTISCEVRLVVHPSLHHQSICKLSSLSLLKSECVGENIKSRIRFRACADNKSHKATLDATAAQDV